MSEPALTVGAATQVINLVSVVVVPVQAPVPTTVNVAVKDPEPTEGVNTYVEGSVPLPDQVPRPPPPDQDGFPVLPPPEAPVIVIAPLLHSDRFDPAFAIGPLDQVTVLS